MNILGKITQNYTEEFPHAVHFKAVQGATTTVAINLIVGRALNVALIGGVLAIISSLVEAVTRPIITTIFKDHPVIVAVIQAVVAQMITLGLATAVASWVGVAYTVNSFFHSLLFFLTLNKNYIKHNIGVAFVL